MGNEDTTTNYPEVCEETETKCIECCEDCPYIVKRIDGAT